jgi:hypothetical protein
LPKVIAIQKSPPVVACYDCEDMAYHGELLARRLLDQLSECLKTDNWPRRYEKELTCELPLYACEETTNA